MSWIPHLFWTCLILYGTAFAGPLETPVVGKVHLDSRGFPVVEITNGSKNIFSYRGYSAANPIYKMEALEEGKWVDRNHGWCGTDLEVFELPPGSKTTMILIGTDFDESPAKPRRVSFRFFKNSKTGQNERIEVCVVSCPDIHLPLKPKD